MKKLLATILFAAALLTACDKIEQPAANIAAGDSVPAFTATFSDGTVLDSRSLASGDGRSLVVFFNTGCSDCTAFLPVLQRLYDKWGKAVGFWPISRQQGDKQIKKFWDDNDLTMPYSAQKDKKIYNMFAGEGIPRIYDIYGGKVQKVFTDADDLSFEALDKYLSDTSLVIDVE